MNSDDPRLVEARRQLSRFWGYDTFRGGQERAVGSILEGRDTVIVMPTGGGKSICYQVPALLLDGLTIVVSPLISLMKDQVDRLQSVGIPALLVNSSLEAGELADSFRKVDSGEVKLLYVAPERFDNAGFLERARRWKVALLAVDEAHCVSQWGHDFRPAYLRIGGVRPALGNPPIAALTATATPEVRRDIEVQLGLRDSNSFVTGFDRRNLLWRVDQLKNDSEKDRRLLELLRNLEGSAVVYAATRKNVEALTALLRGLAVPAVGYHAGLPDAERKGLQEAFMTGKSRVVCATNAFGMGIDKPDVRLVVHYEMPGSLEAYYQEAGRAGRDGNQANCVLLHAYRDRFTHEFFLESTHPSRRVIEETLAESRRRADSSGAVTRPLAELATGVPAAKGDRQVASALRILEEHGIVAGTRGRSGESVGVMRLIASPKRIQRELGAKGRVEELRFLRSLWKLAGGDVIHRGVGLPPREVHRIAGGFGRSRELLGRLQNEGFLEWTERQVSGFIVLDTATESGRLPIDWKRLEMRRETDFQKLQAMQAYVYTDECRRAFVLRYFGEEGVDRSCGACDTCLGTRAKPAAATGARGRIGAASGKMRIPRLASAARGDTRASSVRDGKDESSARKDKGSGEVRRPEPGSADAELLSELKRLRTSIAAAEKLPAYCVFSDATLLEIAIRCPRSLDDLLQVRGVGPAKASKYGEQFLAPFVDRPGAEGPAAYLSPQN